MVSAYIKHTAWISTAMFLWGKWIWSTCSHSYRTCHSKGELVSVEWNQQYNLYIEIYRILSMETLLLSYILFLMPNSNQPLLRDHLIEVLVKMQVCFNDLTFLYLLQPNSSSKRLNWEKREQLNGRDEWSASLIISALDFLNTSVSLVHVCFRTCLVITRNEYDRVHVSFANAFELFKLAYFTA